MFVRNALGINKTNWPILLRDGLLTNIAIVFVLSSTLKSVNINDVKNHDL